tara:strand:+ start:8401 stop:9264 length:864 start_codon:yes stop_codon:yes gene_type:complete
MLKINIDRTGYKMQELICWNNGTYKPLGEVTLSILDFGFIHSDATYDVMKTSNSKILFFDKHLTRYTNSCNYFGFSPVEDIESIVQELLAVNNITDAFVWVCNWRGTPPSGSPRDMSGPDNRVVYVKPYYGIKDSSITLGIHTKNTRTPDTVVSQKFKNFGWIELTQAQKYADNNQFDSAIVLDDNRFICEGPGFGICFVSNNTVITPMQNCLDSITIQVVNDVCNGLNIPFVRKNITVEEALDADECFICSTSGGITPVSSIEWHSGYKTELTNKLIKEFKQHETN